MYKYVAIFLFVFFVACCSNNQPPAGEFGGPCFEDQTCDTGLVCNPAGNCDCKHSGSFKATLVAYSSGVPQGGKLVWALDNATGEKLPPGLVTASCPDGTVAFDGLPNGLVGFLAEDRPDFFDTYLFNESSNSQDEKLWIVDKPTIAFTPDEVGISIDETKGMIIGGFYWMNSNGERENVTCGTVGSQNCAEDTTNPQYSCGIRYFNDQGLPTDVIAKTINGAHTPGRLGINTLNGSFLMANMVYGGATIRGYSDNTEFASQYTVTHQGVNSITIVNLYAEAAQNPGLDRINDEDPCLVYEICDNTRDDDQDTLTDCDDPDCEGVGSCP